MFSSLRTRMWISYAILTGAAMVVVGIGLVWSLSRNPLLYRQTILRMRLAEAALGIQLESMLDSPQDKLAKFVSKEAKDRNLRLVILKDEHTTMLDTEAGRSPPLPVTLLKTLPDEPDPIRISDFRDNRGTRWLYTISNLKNDYRLVVLANRPNLSLAAVLRDELIEPILLAGGLALVLSIFLSLIMARWVTDPLQRLAKATLNLADGKYEIMPLVGPREVKQLAKSFNEMVDRVRLSQRSQRDFIANVSHELKTPLTSIQGFAQAILEGAIQNAEDLKGVANIIFSEAGRMNRLVMDLLSLARLESGTADMHLALIDLRPILDGLAARFEPQARQAGIQIRFDIHPQLWVMGDGDRLGQVFSNLIDNAIKYTPTNGSVEISTKLDHHSVVVIVRDTGIGITTEEQARIFERFYQVDKSRRGDTGRGVGLGLPIAHQIVLAHGGEMRVESAPGNGSAFIVSLPSDKNIEPPQV